MSVVASPQLRWSSVRDCPRKAVFEATGVPARERTDKDERILWRGKSLGRDYSEFLAVRYGRENVLTEVKVRWPLGVGHIDVVLVPTKTAIEVLSSAHASDQMTRSKMLQLVGYMEHYPKVENGALVVLNPSDFSEEVFPLSKTSKTYRELVDEMRDRIGQVQSWADGGDIPARVCGKPSDARSHFCLYTAHCFDGWEPPTLPNVGDDPQTRTLVAGLYQAKQEERARRADLATAETHRKELEQQLDSLVPVGKHRSAGFEITRTHVQRKPTFQWEKAETAGVFDPEALPDFFKPGASYSTWRVEPVSDEPRVPEGFGDEAPWTDADLEGPWAANHGRRY